MRIALTDPSWSARRLPLEKSVIRPAASGAGVPRVAIDWPATMIGPGRDSHPCTIRDFCAQGMLLAVDHVRAPSHQACELHPQDPISVRFSAALDDTSVTYELAACVAWKVGDSLGIAVIGSHKESYNHKLCMKGKGGGVFLMVFEIINSY